MKDIKYKWLPNGVTLRKLNEDEYGIYYHGHLIDKVGKVWYRLGGAGWSYEGSHWARKTLKEAVLDCYRKKHKM